MNTKTIRADPKRRKREAPTPRKPAAPVVLAEAPRPSGGRLRVTRETVAGRRVVRLLHFAAPGALVFGFAPDVSEVPGVVAALVKGAA